MPIYFSRYKQNVNDIISILCKPSAAHRLIGVLEIYFSCACPMHMKLTQFIPHANNCNLKNIFIFCYNNMKTYTHSGSVKW